MQCVFLFLFRNACDHKQAMFSSCCRCFTWEAANCIIIDPLLHAFYLLDVLICWEMFLSDADRSIVVARCVSLCFRFSVKLVLTHSTIGTWKKKVRTVEQMYEKVILQSGYLGGLRSSLGGWTQKVKSWYWGRPLVSFRSSSTVACGLIDWAQIFYYYIFTIHIQVMSCWHDKLAIDDHTKPKKYR